jgi:hypothetical protein
VSADTTIRQDVPADARDGRGSGTGRGASWIPVLLRDRAFRRYWSGQSISMFGDQISTVALPLVAVLTLRVGPAQMGLAGPAGNIRPSRALYAARPGGPQSCRLRSPLGLVAVVVPSGCRCSVQPHRWMTVR